MLCFFGGEKRLDQKIIGPCQVIPKHVNDVMCSAMHEHISKNISESREPCQLMCLCRGWGRPSASDCAHDSISSTDLDNSKLFRSIHNCQKT